MDLLEKLNRLLERNHDAMNGYLEAAEIVENNRLEKLFVKHATQRNEFIKSLNREIDVMGGEPKEGGSAIARLHRAWMDLRSSVSSGDEESLIKECIRGEEMSLVDYDSILRSDANMSASLYNMVKGQRDIVESYVRELKTSMPKRA